MVTVVDEATVVVFTGNVAVVAPAGTVTLGGTLAAPLLLESATCAPPVGAGPLNVTVPVDEFPPTTLAGFTVSEESEAPVVLLPGASSNSRIAGFGSFREIPTNFEAEITYTSPFPPVPELTVMVPLPLVGEADTA